MTRTEIKLFASWDYELEELWLNHMASQGWHLKKVTIGTVFTFEKGEPDAYQYRLEMMDSDNQAEYVRFMEEAGIEKIGGYIDWAYFRKKNDGSGFDLFSNNQSRLKHLNRIYKRTHILFLLLTTLLCIDYALFFIEAVTGGDADNLLTMLPCVLVDLWLGQGCRKLKWKIADMEQEQTIHE